MYPRWIMMCDDMYFFFSCVACVDFANFFPVSSRNYFYQFDSLVLRGAPQPRDKKSWTKLA